MTPDTQIHLHAAAQQYQISLEAVLAMHAINELRAEEGSAVTILCSNPEPVSRDQEETIVVCASWTGWNEMRFAGETVHEALVAAFTAKQASEEKS